MALIRYPGSKDKLVSELSKLFPSEVLHPLWSSAKNWEYREPFFGAGAVGFRLLPHISKSCRVWLNDKDEDLVMLWRTVKDEPKPLCCHVTMFQPSVENFYDFKERDGKADASDSYRGFRKLALHRMSVSGFGVKSGGPIGGRHQNGSAYTVECRWNPERIKRDVMRLSKVLRRFESLRITCGDFAPLMEDAGEQCFVYLDPPYFAKGEQLYRHAMNDADHARLAAILRQATCQWVLSYDDHQRIRELYSWAEFSELLITYTNAVTSSRRPKNKEVAITPKEE